MTEVCKAANFGQTAMRHRAQQLQDERGGKTPVKSNALTPGHQEIRRPKREKEILKKASSLLMSENFHGSH